MTWRRMSTRWTLLLALSTVLISGCASGPAFIYIKPGLTQDQLPIHTKSCLEFGKKSTEQGFGRRILVDLLAGAGTSERLRQQKIAALSRHCLDGFGYMTVWLTPEQRKAYAKLESPEEQARFRRELVETHPNQNEHVARARAGDPPIFRGAWIGESDGLAIDLAITNMTVSGAVSCRGKNERFAGIIAWDGGVTVTGGIRGERVTGVMPDLNLNFGGDCPNGPVTMQKDANCRGGGSAACDRYAGMRRSQRRAVEIAMAGGVLAHSRTEDEDIPRQFEPPPPTNPGIAGAGFVVNRNGAVLTNYRLVAQCDELQILYDGATTGARAAATDPVNDLALLRANRNFTTEARVATARPRPGTRVRIPAPAKDGRTDIVGGSIATRTGPNGDIRMFGLDTKIAEPRIGAPIVGPDGTVAGMAISSGAALRLAESRKGARGDNGFAIAPSVLRNFLGSAETMGSGRPNRDSVRPVEPGRFTVGIQCLDGDTGSTSRKPPKPAGQPAS